MADILPYLERLRERFVDPALQEHFKNYNRNIQFEFTDLGKMYLLSKSGDQGAILEEKSLPDPDVLVTTTTDVLAGIMDRKVNPMTAYTLRKIKAKGAMEDLLKLQRLL